MNAELLNRALLGTQRQGYAPPTTDDEKLAALLRPLEDAPPEKALLSAAGVLAAYESAGLVAAKISVQSAEPAPAEISPACSPRAAFLLERVLAENKQDLLNLWLEKASAAKVRVPSKYLVELISLSPTRSNLAGLISSVTGERGKWLAALNPAWSGQNIQPMDEAAWNEGTLQVRTAYLGSVRKTDPARARTLLQEVWKQEPAKERAQFVRTLELHLTMDDERFLEESLDDRSKEVRAVAALLLSRLPESRFSQRMQERAASLIRANKKLLGGVKLEVKLPEVADEAMKRDSIEERQIPGADFGKKASLLYQVIEAVPPGWWKSHYGIEPDAWIKAAAKTDWEGPLILGWASAAADRHEATWLEAMLDDGGSKLLKEEHRRHQLISALPEAQRRSRLLAEMQSDKFENVQLLQSLEQDWDLEFSRAVLKRFVSPIGSKSTNWRYGTREMLRGFAVRLHPAAFKEAEELATDADMDSSARDALIEFVEMFRLRCEILAEFAEASAA